MVFSVRTLFLFIRGIDQTGRAVDSASAGIKELITNEKLLAEVSQRLLFAGAAFLTFGAMAAGAMGKIIADTERGAVYMDDFAIAIGRLKTAFSNILLEKYGDELEDIIYQINELAQSDSVELVVDIAFNVTKALLNIGPALIGLGLAGKLLAALGGALGAGSALSVINQVGLAGALTGAAGVGGAAAVVGTIVMGLGLTIAIGAILWNIIPEEWRQSIKEFITGVKDRFAKDSQAIWDNTYGDPDPSLGDTSYFQNQEQQRWGNIGISSQMASDNYLHTYIDYVSIQATREEAEEASTEVILDAWLQK